MAAKLDRERVRGLVEPHWRRLYNFMFRLTLDRSRAERYLADVFAQAASGEADPPANPADVEVWLLGIGTPVLGVALILRFIVRGSPVQADAGTAEAPSGGSNAKRAA